MRVTETGTPASSPESDSATDLAPVVQKIASGRWRDAVPLLVGFVGTSVGGPLLGALGAGTATLVAELLANTAENRMQREGARLDSEEERAAQIASYLRTALAGLREREFEQLRLLVTEFTGNAELASGELFRKLTLVLQDFDGRLDAHFREIGTRMDRQAEALAWIETVTAARFRETDAAAATRHREVLDAISRAKGIDGAVLKPILARLGEANVSDERVAEVLSKKADEYIAFRAELQTLRLPEIDAVRAEVAASLENGNLESGRGRLQALRANLTLRRSEMQRAEAILISDEARIYRIEVRYRDAAAKYAEAAQLVREVDQEQYVRYLWEQGRALCDEGDELGDNGALIDAIAAFERALGVCSREDAPLDWAATQNNLGNALLFLGERENGTARLKQAVLAYQECLKAYTRDRVPLHCNPSATGVFQLG